MKNKIEKNFFMIASAQYDDKIPDIDLVFKAKENYIFMNCNSFSLTQHRKWQKGKKRKEGKPDFAEKCYERN